MNKVMFLLGASALVSSLPAAVLLTELHYDNAGGDVGEVAEVYISTGTDLTTVGLTLYNGSNGTSYGSTTGDALTDSMATVVLDGITYGIYTWAPSSIQNGGPDGIAISEAGALVEFLSYEGTFTASGGPADGVLSIDLGVAESSSTPIGASLGRTDAGWVVNDTANFGTADPLLSTAIPEPSSALLGGIALLGLLRRRR